MLPTKTLNPLGRIFLGNCYLFLLVNSLAINSQKKLHICLKKIATQHKREPLANPKSRRKQSSLLSSPNNKAHSKEWALLRGRFGFRHFSDEKCFRACPHGFCLSALRRCGFAASNKNIAPPFRVGKRFYFVLRRCFF